MRTISILTLIILCTFISWSIMAYAAESGAEIIGNQSIICGYLNMGHIYQRITQGVKDINDEKNESIKRAAQILHFQLGPSMTNSSSDAVEDCRKIARIIMGASEMYMMDHSDYSNLNVDELLAQKYLRSKPICPAGGVYSVSGDLYTNDGGIVCSIHGHMSAGSFSSTQQSQPPAQTVTFDEMLKRFEAFHNDKILLPEGKAWFAIDNNLDFRVVIHGSFKPLDIYQTLVSLQIWMPDDRTVDSQKLTFNIPMQNYKSARLEIFTNKILISTAEHEPGHKNHWQNFKATAEDDKTIMSVEYNGLRFLQIALEEIAFARQHRCFANLKVMSGATRSYNDYNSEKITNLNVTELINAGFLRFAPQCPDKGAYTSKGDLSKQGQIFCSVHGSTSSPAELSIEDIEVTAPSSEIKHIHRANITVGLNESLLSLKVANPQLLSRMKDSMLSSGLSGALVPLMPEAAAGVAAFADPQLDESNIFVEGDIIGYRWKDSGIDELLNHLMGVMK